VFLPSPSRLLWLFPLLLGLGQLACAELHSTAIGEIDGPLRGGQPIDLKVSDTGVNLGEAASLAGALSGSKAGRRQSSSLSDVISLFQWGPTTGNPTFSEDFADEMLTRLQQACPSLRVTGLVLVRETNKYPVISGEIVRLKGYCLP
jgi:hypothetical protein